MLIAFYDAYSILAKVYSDKAFLKQAILATPIEEKNRALTIKTCYGVLDKDIELSYYIAALSPKNPKLAVRVVLKIAMYNIKYLHKHPGERLRKRLAAPLFRTGNTAARR